MKIATIFGTRPEIIKLSTLIPRLNDEFEQILIHTNQHYDFEMDALFFKELELPQPDYHLNVGSRTPGEQTGLMIEKIEKVLIQEKPDMVIVQGDTNSTLSGALAASKLNIRVAHVEAGCRSFNKNMPEELNRIITDHISEYLFAPNKESVDNLSREGIVKNVFNVGSLAIDSCLRNQSLSDKSEIINKLSLEQGNYIVATIHRAENTNNIDNLKSIIEALNEISKIVKVVFPIHPRTKKILNDNQINLGEGIIKIEPLGYLDFLNLVKNSKIVMSDSGGIQEEAGVLNIPCLILRNETEWTGLVDAGKNMLIGNKKEDIIKKTELLLSSQESINKMKNAEYEQKTGVDKEIINLLKKI